MSALDGRAPYVLDIRELGRRAGAMMTFDLTEPAPADFLNPMIGVPDGADLDMDLMAESVVEGVLISGTVTGIGKGSCSRCLEPISEPIEVEIQELFRYSDLDSEDGDDEELPTLDGDLIDIEPTLRDAVVLALPIAPVCSEECLGLCSTCGERLADLPADHQHDQTDPRWAALAGFGEQSPGTDLGTESKG